MTTHDETYEIPADIAAKLVDWDRDHYTRILSLMQPGGQSIKTDCYAIGKRATVRRVSADEWAITFSGRKSDEHRGLTLKDAIQTLIDAHHGA